MPCTTLNRQSMRPVGMADESGDKAVEAAQAAIKAGSPSLAGAILAADVLGIDLKDPRVMEAAWHADVQTRRAGDVETGRRQSKPDKGEEAE